MAMNFRLLEVRRFLKLNQEEFGKRVELSKPSISALENGTREITDRTVKLICSEFNVNEQWFRTGQGEMFVQSESFSLDEYASKSNLSALEYDIIRGYMDLDEGTRRTLLSHFASIFNRHAETAATREMDIEQEVANYRRELEEEKNTRTLSVSRYESGSA